MNTRSPLHFALSAGAFDSKLGTYVHEEVLIREANRLKGMEATIVAISEAPEYADVGSAATMICIFCIFC